LFRPSGCYSENCSSIRFSACAPSLFSFDEDRIRAIEEGLCRDQGSPPFVFTATLTAGRHKEGDVSNRRAHRLIAVKPDLKFILTYSRPKASQAKALTLLLGWQIVLQTGVPCREFSRRFTKRL
jgi:hypothetical protein